MARHVDVEVAIVQDEKKRFYVAYNEKWRGYSFPMSKLRGSDQRAGAGALRALQEATTVPLGDCQIDPLREMDRRGISARTRGRTIYHYYPYEIEPARMPLDGGFASRGGYLTYDELMASEMVTWSAREIAQGLVEKQEAAIAIVSRWREDERYYLLFWHGGHRNLFFPVARLRADFDTPRCAAVEAIRADTGYQGLILVERVTRAEGIQRSPRYQRERDYLFHVCKVELPAAREIGWDQPKNPFYYFLNKREAIPYWFSQTEIQQAIDQNGLEDRGLSPTVTMIWDAVLSLEQQGEKQ